MLCGLTAAYALAPDIDQCGSTSARSLGFVTEALAWVIRKVSGGHRHGTHSLVGVGTFTAVAWLACLFRDTWPGRVVLALALAAGLAAAADALRPGPATFENVLGLVAAGTICYTGYGLARPLSFTTGTWRERWIVVPVLFGALAWLSYGT